MNGLVEIVDFARREDFGVAGQDLFDERAPRARHADDEDRSPRPFALAGMGAHDIRRKGRPHAVHDLELGCLVIVHLLEFERVAVEQMPERLAIASKVRIRLAESKVQIDLFVAVERGHVARQFLHREDMRILRRQFFVFRQVEVKTHGPGREFDGRRDGIVRVFKRPSSANKRPLLL